MRLQLLPIIAIAFPLLVFGQKAKDSIEIAALPPFFVTEIRPSFISTSRNIIAITHSEMKESGGQTLSDALSRLPGVGQITTGAISKPVIRGLYGNRLQVNVGGVRLEDQQWEDELGLGLSEVGVERVELIKGPAALLFGSDAMGGVVNIIEEQFDTIDHSGKVYQAKTKQNLNLELFSNTYGFGTDYGFKHKTKKNNEWILHAGIENHADYSDGHGNRVPNTRFAMYNVKAGYIVRKARWISENRLYTAFNQFGFIKDTSEIQEAASENRLSREFEDEHHNVLYNILSSRNQYKINNQLTWHTTAAYQRNSRQEQEGEETTELDLQLQTFNLNSALHYQLKNNILWVNGAAGMFQTNTNSGSRIIIPDAKTLEGSAFSYLKKAWVNDHFSLHTEAGLRFDRRNIRTLLTRDFNLPGSARPVFDRSYDAVNGSVGGSLVTAHWVIKTDIATGFRPANLAELSANGTHEGTNRWDLGDPGLKTEQCVNMDVSGQYHYQYWTVRGSVFQNRFNNYIYIAPTNETYQSYPLYRYLQTDAVFRGFEAGLAWENNRIAHIAIDYSFLTAKANTGEWLPFIPANRLTAKSKWFIPLPGNRFESTYFAFNTTCSQAQTHTAPYETATPAYWLLSAGAGTTYKRMRFLLTCTNLTNTYYNDHLSRLKYIGMRDMGRNVVLNMGWQF